MGGGGGGGSSAPVSSGGGGGGGGGGYTPPKPTPKPTPKPKPTPTPTPEPPKPEGPKQYIDSGKGEAGKSTMQVSGDGGGDASSSYQGATSGGGQLGADKSVTKFIPGEGEGSKADVLDAVLGSDPLEEYAGTSPFQGEGLQRGEGYLGQNLQATQEVPGLDAAVDNQPMAPAVGGGDVGVGAQGFGQRALIGGEAAIQEAAGAESNAVNTAMPAEQAPSDVQKDPGYITPAPGKAYIADYNFTLPFFRNPNVVAFLRGSRDAGLRAKGPISRGLMSARSGFGRRFF